MPSPVPEPPMATAAQIDMVEAHMRTGMGMPEALQRAGISKATYYRWHERAKNGTAAEGKPGRPVALELNAEEEAAIKALYADYNSLTEAVRTYVKDGGHTRRSGEFIAARPAVIDYLSTALTKAREAGRHPVWPRAFRARVTPDRYETAAHGGPKAAGYEEISAVRGDWYNDEDGRVDMHPMSIMECDDVSLNEHCTWCDPATGEWLLGRQTLASRDVYSASWLGFTAVGREKDAYRAEDIAGHLLAVMESVGMPEILRLEKGTWDGHFIHGTPIPDKWLTEAQRNAGGERFGDLADLMRVVNKHKSRGKGGIESDFDDVQKMLAREGVTMGRKRGVNEAASRELRRAQAGIPDALRKFMTMDERMEALTEKCAELHTRGKLRTLLGGQMASPDEMWASKPSVGRPVRPEQRWYFAPVKTWARAYMGKVRRRAAHYKAPFEFRLWGALPERLLDGHRLLIAFHPGHPEQGAQIFNAERRPEINRGRYGWRQYLGTVPAMAVVPQEDFSRKADYGDIQSAGAAVRSDFRAMRDAGSHIGGMPGRAQLRTIKQARDGLGSHLIAAKGGQSAQDAAAAAEPISRGGASAPARRVKPGVEKPAPAMPVENSLSLIAAAASAPGSDF